MMSDVYIPAQTPTATGDSANVLFYDASTGGNRVRGLYLIAADGSRGTLVPNGVTVIGASTAAIGPWLADTEANVIFFQDTTGTRTQVATNYKPFKLVQKTILTKNANVTLADTQISFYGVANATYDVDLTLDITATSGTPDSKFQWTVPSGGAVLSTLVPLTGVAAAGTATAGVAANADLIIGTLNGTCRNKVTAKVTIGSTAGAVTLTFAQNTSDASNTSVAVGSSAIVARTT
jgi:hypothetical protein